VSDAISKAIEAMHMARSAVGPFAVVVTRKLTESIDALQALQSGEPVVPALPTMQKAFVTAESGYGKYCLVFKFRTLGDLQAAHNEWVTQQAPQPAVDVTGMDEEDAMFTQIEAKARATYRRHSFSAKGQIITRADGYESHLVWAAIDWAKANTTPQPVVPELTGKQWSAMRDEFIFYATKFRDADHSEIASACADAAPVGIYKALLSAGKENKNE
jgi:hypothetical protein